MVVPVFLLDSREKWLPVGVEESLAAAGVKWSAAAKRLDFPSTMKPANLPPVVYHRVVLGGGLWWHQYWTWWLYNPKKYAGFGAHEGDWEMVQLGCTDLAGDRPVLMTCSQHNGGEKREYWRVQLDHGQPVVYVARDSHANYFTPHQDVTDVANGHGHVIDEPEVRPFGPWATWPGQWGNSDNSPGPLSTRRAWLAPHAYHSQAR